MIGRAAQGNPWIFREIAHRLRHSAPLAPPSIAEVREVLLEHVAALHAFYGEPAGVRIARKHLGWYAKGRRDNEAFRAVVYRAETAAEQIALTRDYFDALESGGGSEPPFAALTSGAEGRAAAGTPPNLRSRRPNSRSALSNATSSNSGQYLSTNSNSA